MSSNIVATAWTVHLFRRNNCYWYTQSVSCTAIKTRARIQHFCFLPFFFFLWKHFARFACLFVLSFWKSILLFEVFQVFWAMSLNHISSDMRSEQKFCNWISISSASQRCVPFCLSLYMHCACIHNESVIQSANYLNLFRFFFAPIHFSSSFIRCR